MFITVNKRCSIISLFPWLGARVFGIGFCNQFADHNISSTRFNPSYKNTKNEKEKGSKKY